MEGYGGRVEGLAAGRAIVEVDLAGHSKGDVVIYLSVEAECPLVRDLRER
jgi:hypothetical protein